MHAFAQFIGDDNDDGSGSWLPRRNHLSTIYLDLYEYISEVDRSSFTLVNSDGL